MFCRDSFCRICSKHYHIFPASFRFGIAEIQIAINKQYSLRRLWRKPWFAKRTGGSISLSSSNNPQDTNSIGSSRRNRRARRASRGSLYAPTGATSTRQKSPTAILARSLTIMRGLNMPRCVLCACTKQGGWPRCLQRQRLKASTQTGRRG